MPFGRRHPCRFFFITIIFFAGLSRHLADAQLTTEAPPQATAAGEGQDYPEAVAVLPPVREDSPILESDTQTYQGGVFVLTGHVVVTSGAGREQRRAEADNITYDSRTGELTLTGHVFLTAALNDERLHATHGTYNLKTHTGRFFGVTGSVGVKPRQGNHLPSTAPALAGEPNATRILYTTTNPFLFSGRMVVESGPRVYDIYDGSVTSCLLPRPDWLLTAAHFSVEGDVARAHNSLFRLLNVPVFYLPYVTHATNPEARTPGFLIPIIGQSGTRGLILGEQIYAPLGRSADLLVGAEYYSSIGWEQNAAFRYRGRGLDFVTSRYNGVLDRRAGTANQGGEDISLQGRRDFTVNTRAVATIEYLSSYIYREAFSNEFNQAVNSDILSTGFVATHRNGIEFAGLADRYQGIKLIAQGTTPQQQVRIFHAPALSVSSTDHRLGITALELSLDASADGLKRTQPNLTANGTLARFATSGIVERFDFHPRLALPLHLGEWNLVPALAGRETFYSRSRVPSAPGQPLQESPFSLSRSDFEFSLDLRPPVIERTFTVPQRLVPYLGSEVRHTIEPAVDYRITTGISNFASILRFDDTDVASNTNEVQYGVTQRLFRKVSGDRPCRTAADFSAGLNPEGTGADPPVDAGGSGLPVAAAAAHPAGAAATECRNEELISWTLTQKYFFDPTFGNAIQTGRRNVFQTTLDLSGIAFLTEPRNISPLISRLRVRTSANTDFEWDFDFDTGARKFTSSNVFIDLHRGNVFSALSYARLDAPGRFYTEGDPTATGSTQGVTTAVSDFNQLRFLVGYGSPAKPGLSVAANIGLDLKSLYGATSTTTINGVQASTTIYPALTQYTALQTSYNWNCCGVAFEYRKFNLGTVRNDPGYRFNFTLANIGTAGNLRRAERLF